MTENLKGRKQNCLEIDGWLERILKHMFRVVGEVYSPEYVQEPEWFLRHEWTRLQEDDFRIWLRRTLKKMHPWKYMGVERLSEEVGFFLLNYGWRTKDG